VLVKHTQPVVRYRQSHSLHQVFLVAPSGIVVQEENLLLIKRLVVPWGCIPRLLASMFSLLMASHSRH
jgi:hypothetical protein